MPDSREPKLPHSLPNRGSRSKIISVVAASAASYIEFALYLACGVLVARGLGPEQYGIYAFSVWLCGWLILVANNGLNISAIRYIAEARGRNEQFRAVHLAGLMRRWQLLTIGIVTVLATVVLAVRPPSEWVAQLPWFILIAIVSTWARSSFLMNVSIGKGFEDYSLGNLCGVAGAILSLILICVWKFINGGLLGYFAIYALSGLMAYIASAIVVKKHLPSNLGIVEQTSEHANSMLKNTALTGGFAVIATLNTRTFETIFLKYYFAPELVGYFVIAGALSKGINELLASGYEKVLLPTMAKAVGSAGHSGIASSVSESIRMYWFFGMVSAGIGIVCSESLVALLYGKSFSIAGIPTMICLVVGGVTSFVGALNAVQISTDNQTDRIKGSLIAISCNLVAAIVLVPRFGLMGAVGALVIGTLSNMLISVWMVKRKFTFQFPVRSMVLLSTAQIITSAFVYPLNRLIETNWRLFPIGTCFLLLFVLLTFILKIWTKNDFDAFLQLTSGPGRLRAVSARFLNWSKRRFAIK